MHPVTGFRSVPAPGASGGNYEIFSNIAGCGKPCAGLATAQQPAYAVIDLGPVGGTPGQPFFITNSGLVSGAAAVADGSTHAVLWYPGLGLRVDIGARGLGGPDSQAYVANDKGKVAGLAETSMPDRNGEDFCGFKALGHPSSGVCLPVT